MSSAPKRSKRPASPKAAETPEEAVQALGTVESKTPGRMRVRLKPELRTPENMAKIQQQSNNHPDIGQTTVNQRTGSVVIIHDKGRDGHEVFKEATEDLELAAGLLLDVPVGDDGGDGGDGGEYGKLDQTLTDLVYRCDKWVYKRTGLRFRGQILAGGVAAAGVAQIAIYGIGLELLPGPVLLYIAYDIYHRESKEPPLDAEEAVAANGSVAQQNTQLLGQEIGLTGPRP